VSRRKAKPAPPVRFAPIAIGTAVISDLPPEEVVRRVLSAALKGGATEAEVWLAGQLFGLSEGLRVDHHRSLREAAPLVASRRRSNDGLSRKRHVPQQKATPEKIRAVLRVATSNKDAARRLRVSLRTVATYKKKYAQR
jgi:DNA-binding NarL/FixJ family response regulator